MKGYFNLAVLAAGVVLSSCVMTTPPGLQPVTAPTLEQLDGDWTGDWQTENVRGGIAMTIKPASSYAVTTIDGDPYATKNTWQSEVRIAGDEVIIDAHGFQRTETYTLYTDADGGLVLDGGYTYRGKPWGKVRLHKQPL